MTREALADRLINYSDALAAFGFVNAFAFVITLADPDIRCSIARIIVATIGANMLFAALITAGLVALRRLEKSLRSQSPVDEEVEQFWRIAHILRIVIVWAITGMVSFGLYAATFDPTCAS